VEDKQENKTKETMDIGMNDTTFTNECQHCTGNDEESMGDKEGMILEDKEDKRNEKENGMMTLLSPMKVSITWVMMMNVWTAKKG